MASLYEIDPETVQNGSQSSSSSSDTDDVEIVQELKVSLQEHMCDLCCKGTFLVDKLLKFGGVKHKYHCEVCFSSFKKKSEALKHAKTHDLSKESKTPEQVVETSTPRSGTLSCPYCLFHTTSEVGLKRHTTNQHSVPYTCEKCGVTFKSEKKLRQHSDTRCNMQRKMKNCPICRRSFIYEKSFKEHVCSIVVD